MVPDPGSKLAQNEGGYPVTRREPDCGYTNRLSDIAQPLDLTAITLGKLMQVAGLREGAEPSAFALESGIATERYNGYAHAFDWHIERTTKYLQKQMGQELSVASEIVKTRRGRAEDKQIREMRKQRLEQEEQDRIRHLGIQIRTLIEDQDESLLSAVELIVETPNDRPAVYKERLGFWKARKTKGLKTTVPEDMNAIRDFQGRCDRELSLLVRRAENG